ncbi:MAG: N-acetylglutaminylglutamine amidotransferase [Candidatus Thiodiazotropha sp.]
MCGLCGELRFDGRGADLGILERMSERIRRRGPDHGGSYSDGALGFAHRRLSIIDLSEHANQPMVDQKLNLALVFNGTIYNYKTLRDTLRGMGYAFFSDGDTEVILKAYHAWGEDCVDRLSGMFAFAIWDTQAKRLFLARDRFGIKPLYYSQDASRFRFASNTQALLAGGDMDTRLDPMALHYQFTLHGMVPAPHTVFRGIRKLAPGHTLTIEANGAERIRAYWRYPATRPETPMSENDWLDAIHEQLREAVRKRNDIADVPVGVLLSGGLDSSLLVALLAEAGVTDLHTFSVGFEDQPEEKGNEFEYSDPVAERYATRHHKFLVANGEVLKRLPEAVDNMAEPMFGQDAVAFYLLGEQVSRQIKVVQSGQGADEVFGGYFWYPRIAEEQAGAPVERFARHYFDRDHDEYLRMVTPEYAGEDYTRALLRERLEACEADSLIDAVMYVDQTMLIVDDPVKRVDNMTMAWGLEARVPFLDQDLVSLAARCPPELKLKEGGKYPLKAMARGLLPEKVIDRPKGYFPMPALKYVRGEFLEFMKDILSDGAARQRGVFQPKYMESLLAAPDMHHTRIRGSKLWHIALFEFWLQRHLA